MINETSGIAAGRQLTQSMMEIRRPSVRETLLAARENHEIQLARIAEAIDLLDAAPQLERLHDLLNSIR